ncbi:hypothetical protein JXL21_02630 [Candidatus Bathyarchaeota archaeon]|nr:hypothetical protein [Candidatus Bathyarchaeota archaeon]
MELDEYFAGRVESRTIFDALREAVESLGPVEVRVSKSQVSFRRRVAFAWAWVLGRYLGDGHAPLVLTLVFSARSESPRWKRIVEPRPGCFTHHMELWSCEDIDDEVISWLGSARKAAE